MDHAQRIQYLEQIIPQLPTGSARTTLETELISLKRGEGPPVIAMPKRARPLPCPCCKQLTDDPGVRLNALASAAAALCNAEELLRRIPKDDEARLQSARALVQAAEAHVLELTE